MKKICVLIACLFFLHQLLAQTPPDLSKINTLADRIEAWRVYCNELLSYSGEGTEPYKKLVLEAKKGLAMVPDDSARIKSMFSLFTGVAYEYTMQYDSAIVYLNQSATIARKLRKTKYEMTALSRLYNIYDYLRKPELCVQMMKRMEQIADTSTDIKIKEQAATMLGGYYRDINDYEKAISYKVKSIDLYKEGLKKGSDEFEPVNLGYELSNIAQVFSEIGQFGRAIDYLEQARPYLKDRAFVGIEETYYVNYVQAFLGLNKIDSAKHYYRLIYDAMKGRDTLFHVLCTANYLFGSYYYDRKHIDSASYFIERARKEGVKSLSRSAPYIQATEMMAMINFRKGNYALTISQLNETLKNSYDFEKRAYADIHKTLAESYAALNRWDSAYSHYVIFSNLNDTLLQAAGNKNFANAEASYQNNEKKLQLKVQSGELAAAHKQRMWLIGGLALAALIALLLVIIYRNKKRAADTLNQKNKQLNELNASLDEANRTKAKLFGIISHDLRSPISQVYQFLKLQQLNPTALNDEQKAALSGKIQLATGSLLETMEDLLTWSKTQMNEFSVSVQPVEVQEIVQQSVELLQLQIGAKKLKVSNQIAPHFILQTDFNCLQTIIRNLLQNAVKASPDDGRIIITTNAQAIQLVNEGPLFTQQQYEDAIENSQASTGLSGFGLKLVDELSRKIGAKLFFDHTDNGFTRANLQF
ncbi:sensor histidine kinase [Pseudoflavitalea sp. G-6-1-2]|uniref:tetratricopeptide repeat-containing sensor histidine kinase n=1 Tax=Pseudoflavitalea sp. G-6-1-2 TaxID=2728841 RepID=UPI00146A467A|nr:HAMP domain-containing sensor histidine kinase [Pseudoflavitalea sp. G-6-1-2]NML23743.1 sensor histidine kinase [Pseudoflavitalea sp. G-6-1-2]